MSGTHAFVLLLAGNVVFLIGLWFARRERRAANEKQKQKRREAAKRSAQARADADEQARRHVATIQEALDAAQAAVASMNVELREQREETERTRQRDEELHARIEGILGERDTWRRQYLEAMGGASAAQNMMVMTIQTLARQVRSLGAKPRITRPMIAVLDAIAAEDQPPGSQVGSEEPGTAGTAIRSPEPGLAGTQSSANPNTSPLERDLGT